MQQSHIRLVTIFATEPGQVPSAEIAAWGPGAGIAIAHKILVSAYRMLTGDLSYRELGETYLDRLTERRVTYNLTRRLGALGYEVTLTKAA